MNQPTDGTKKPDNEFDAAKVIVEALKGLDTPQQMLAMKFASESLKLPIGKEPASAVTGTRIPGVQQTPQLAPTPVEDRPLDIKQFTESKGPKSDMQFAAVVAYYYQFVAPEAQRKDAIEAADLKEAVRLVGRNQPGNPTMTLNNAKNAGYLTAKGGGRFEISSVGENLVAITLGSDASVGAAHSKKSRPKSKKKGASTTKKRKAK